MDMKIKRISSLVTAALIAALCLSSCNGIKRLEDLEITSAKIDKIIPNGLRGAELGFLIGIDNPGTQISLSEISCDVKHFGKVLGKVAVDPVVIQAKTEEIYDLDADVKLGEDATVLDLGRFLDKSAVDELTVDVRARVKLKGGIARNLVFNDLPLKKLIETAKK